MQFQVPQFIEVEDKIFGPLTFKQFVYIAGGAGACYIFARILPMFIAAPLILVTGGFAAALAFFKLNGRPFISALEHAFFFFMHTKLYLWSNKRKVSGTKATVATSSGRPAVYVPKLSDSKLHDLAWSLDIKERIAEGDTERQNATLLTDSGSIAPLRIAQQALVK